MIPEVGSQWLFLCCFSGFGTAVDNGIPSQHERFFLFWCWGPQSEETITYPLDVTSEFFFRPARIPSSCYVAMVGGKCEVWPIKHRGNFQGCFCSKISNNDDNHQVLRRGYVKECGSPG